MKPQGFFRNGGLAMLCGFACLLAALGVSFSSPLETRPVTGLTILGVIQLAGAVGVQMRRIQQLEHLLLGDSPEARKFRRRLQLADSAAEGVPPPSGQPLPPH